MTRQVRVALIIVGAFVIAVTALVVWAGRDDAAEPDATGATDPRLVREDSHVLGTEGTSEVVLVEFLDFECEACGAFYPIVEDLRERYAGEVTFVARYFPLPGHFNAERAARAVESAARQDRFEEMYQKMFENQAAWGERQVPADDVFRGYAEDIGLDLRRYDADYRSTEVAERVQRDLEDGVSLGVESTPTFYLDGEQLRPTSVEDFRSAIEEALAG